MNDYKVILENLSPPSVNNYWVGMGRKRAVSKRGRIFKNILGFKALEAKVPLSVNPIALSVVWWQKGNKRRDVDNILKPILDALTGIAYVDDSQVNEISVKRFKGDAERLEIEIKSLKGECP